MTLRVVAFFALFAVSLGSNLAAAAEPVFPPGSRMGFVPPPGFQVSKRFPGFENPDARSSILMAALPPQAYAEIEASMSTEALKKQGITEDKRQTLVLANGKGLLVMGSEQENGQKYRKWMFLGQLPEGVALIAVLVPETALKTYPDDVIKASLATLAVRASVPMEEQIALIPFKLTNLSGMRPVRVLGSTGVILTEGAKDAPSPGDQPVFVVMIGQGGPEQATDRANFARNLFTGLGDFKDVH